MPGAMAAAPGALLAQDFGDLILEPLASVAVAGIVAMTDQVLEISLVGPRPNFLQLLAQPEMAIVNGRSGSGPRSAGRPRVSGVLILDRSQTRAALDPSRVLTAVTSALVAIAGDEVSAPPRIAARTPAGLLGATRRRDAARRDAADRGLVGGVAQAFQPGDEAAETVVAAPLGELRHRGVVARRGERPLDGQPARAEHREEPDDRHAQRHPPSPRATGSRS